MKKPRDLALVHLSDEQLIAALSNCLGDNLRGPLETVIRELRKERPYDLLTGRRREAAWDDWRTDIRNARQYLYARRDVLLAELIRLKAIVYFDLTAAGGTRWLFLATEGCEQLVDYVINIWGTWTYSSNTDGYYYGTAPVEAVIRNRNQGRAIA